MRSIHSILSFVFVAPALACAHGGPESGASTGTSPGAEVEADAALFEQAEANAALVPDYRTHRFANIYFGGQPSLDDQAALAAAGVRSVVNLRPAGEYDEGAEAAKWRALGVAYQHVPIEKGQSPSPEWLKKVTAAVVQHRAEGKVLVHCSSGNRVGLWIGGHFAADHGLSAEDALKMAEMLGLSHPAAVARMRAYLGLPADAT